MIIGVSGLIGGGKGTVADYLVEKHGFQKISFADTLKDVTAVLFDWERELLEGDTTESRHYRDMIDPYWSAKLEDPDFTPRKALQLMGTEAGRQVFGEGLWVACTEKRLLANKDVDWVIPDARFMNELKSIRGLGGHTLCVERGQRPAWWNAATALNTRDDLDETEMDYAMNKLKNIHASEYSWVGWEFDEVISNNGTLDDLYGATEAFLEVRS